MKFYPVGNGHFYASVGGVMVAYNDGSGWHLANANAHRIQLDEVVNAWRALKF